MVVVLGDAGSFSEGQGVGETRREVWRAVEEARGGEEARGDRGGAYSGERQGRTTNKQRDEVTQVTT